MLPVLATSVDLFRICLLFLLAAFSVFRPLSFSHLPAHLWPWTATVYILSEIPQFTWQNVYVATCGCKTSQTAAYSVWPLPYVLILLLLLPPLLLLLLLLVPQLLLIISMDSALTLVYLFCLLTDEPLTFHLVILALSWPALPVCLHFGPHSLCQKMNSDKCITLTSIQMKNKTWQLSRQSSVLILIAGIYIYIYTAID